MDQGCGYLSLKFMSMGFLALSSCYIIETNEVIMGHTIMSLGHHIFFLVGKIGVQLGGVSLKLPTWVNDNGSLGITLVTMRGTLSLLSSVSKTLLVH